MNAFPFDTKIIFFLFVFVKNLLSISVQNVMFTFSFPRIHTILKIRWKNNIINYAKNAIKAFDFVTIRDIMIRTIIEKCLSVVIHDKKGLFLWLKKQKKMKLNYGKTALIGFGFMAVQIAWIIYNAYVPIILKENNTIANLSWASTAVGMIMVIDNVFGVVFQPLFGRFSDRTHTRFGKRTPYLMVGVPLCALLFIFIPRIQLLGILMLDIIVFNFIMSTWRSPVVAMMPDATPSELRGEGNAVINIMGGVGVVLGTVSGKIITFITKATDEHIIRNYVFLFGSIVMVICLLVVVFLVREPDSRLSKAEAATLAREFEKKKGSKDGKKSLGSMGLT